ncbi:MAG: hypothetical protein JW736_07655 [Deltaproteobacteria bacterium]|nr:hypothetical protein [Deltaproteobacteria bacterium]
MIISRWNGFEIDSSEGYYAFEKNTETADESWVFLEKLLSSPLVWEQVSFALRPREECRRQVSDYLREALIRGTIRKFEYTDEIEKEEVSESRDAYDYADMDDDHLPSHMAPEYQAAIPAFLDAVHDLKSCLLLVSVNFCLKPLAQWNEAEARAFRSWLENQFSDKKKAKERWREYSEVKAEDFSLRGNCEADYSWEPPGVFEANFEMSIAPPASFRVNIPFPDPSLPVYLVSTLIDRYKFIFRGNHRRLDHKPEKLKLAKRR